MTQDNLTQLDWIAGKTHICFSNTDPSLLSVDAIVEEQDTALVLGAAPVLQETVGSFPALIAKMESQHKELPGHVIIKKASTPQRFIAIIYDVDQTPICKWGWVEQALNTIFEQCELLKIMTLAMPLPGLEYGKLQAETVMQEIQRVLRERGSAFPRKIIIYKLEREQHE